MATNDKEDEVMARKARADRLRQQIADLVSPGDTPEGETPESDSPQAESPRAFIQRKMRQRRPKAG